MTETAMLVSNPYEQTPKLSRFSVTRWEVRIEGNPPEIQVRDLMSLRDTGNARKKNNGCLR